MPALMNALVQTYLGDCLYTLPKLPENSVDSVVTDPPAGIKFMSKAWDGDRGGRDKWIDWLSRVMKEALRVVKPGAFGLVWSLPRTSHWTGMALELAGWEIRDRVAHIFGTGFPKSKSCLKPAVEDWWLIKAPGKLRPLQIDACRIGMDTIRSRKDGGFGGNFMDDKWQPIPLTTYGEHEGRWPANLLLDEEAAELLDEMTGTLHPPMSNGNKKGNGYRGGFGQVEQQHTYSDKGGASRFFATFETTETIRFRYCPKASKKDRGEGNIHPTCKPTSLMQWLCRLVTPPGGLVLDPFMGSGSTGLAALREGFRFIGIEKEAEYLAIARDRIRREREGK